MRFQHGRDRVILGHPKPGSAENTYIDRWSSALNQDGVRVIGLSPASLIRYRAAPVHIHWPEHLIAHRNPIRRCIKTGIAMLIIGLLYLWPRKLVWTAHNATPHSSELAGFHRQVFRAVRVLATDVIVTTPDHQRSLINLYSELSDKQFHVIGLGSIAPLVSGKKDRSDEARTTESGAQPAEVPRFLLFGIIAPYKAQLETVESLGPLLQAGELSLTIAGRVGDQGYLDQLLRSTANFSTVRVIARHVDDFELACLLEEADAALALQVGALNSGVIPASVPLGTPVISAATAQAEELHRVLGDDWVYCVDAGMTPEQWRDICRWSRQRRPSSPAEHFSWKSNVELHNAVYFGPSPEP